MSEISREQLHAYLDDQGIEVVEADGHVKLFVQIPTMPKVPAELKPGVTKYIAPVALFWFRWAAVATVVIGLILAELITPGYAANALKLCESGGAPETNRCTARMCGSWRSRRPTSPRGRSASGTGMSEHSIESGNPMFATTKWRLP